MTEPNIVGDVGVEVVPVARTFADELRRKIVPAASRIGDEAGEAMGERLRRAIEDGVEDGLTGADPVRRGTEAGDKYGGAFGRMVRQRIQAALRALPDARIEGDVSDAERKILGIRQEIQHLSGKRIGIDIDEKSALAKLAALRAELDTLKHSEEIHVRLDSSAAAASLRELEKAVSGVVDAASSGASGPGRGPALLGVGLAAGLTLVGPASAVAAAGITGLVAGVGTATLIVKGLGNELKQDTELGHALAGSLSGLGDTLTSLEHAAAKGASGGVLAGLDKINSFMPELEPLVERFSAHLGEAFNLGAEGLISALRAAGPLIDDIGRAIEGGARNLAEFARSEKFREFVEYARRELPIIGHALQEIGTFSINSGAQFASAGGVMIKTLGDIAKTLNDLHISETLAGPAKALEFVAKTTPFESLVNLTSDSGKKTAAALGAVTASQARATEQTSRHDAVVAALAADYGALPSVYESATAAALANRDAVAQQTLEMQLQNDEAGLLTQALDQLNGANLGAAHAQNSFEQSLASSRARAQAAQDALANAQHSNAVASRELAAAQEAVTKASLASEEAQRRLTASRDAEARALAAVTELTKRLASDQKLAKTAAAASKTATATLAQVKADPSSTPKQIAAAQAAADKAAKAASAAAAKAKADQDALGRANVAVANTKRAVADAEDGVKRAALATASAQRQLQSAQESAAQAASALKRAQDAASQSLKGMSDAAIQNRSDLLGQIDAAEGSAEAMAKLPGGAEKARLALINMRDSIEKNALLNGASRAEVEKLLNDLLKIPDHIKTTTWTLDNKQILKRIHEVDAALANLSKNKTPLTDATLQLLAQRTGAGVHVAANGGIFKFFAEGGENHVAQIAPAGAMRIWAEPETGGEAYIPLADAKRARSEAILGEVARKFGGLYKRSGSFADGGITGRPGGPTKVINIDARAYNAVPETASVSRIESLRRAEFQLDSV